MIESIRVLFVLVIVFAAVCLGFQLRHVHDSTNLSRDVGLTGRILAGILSERLCLLARAPRA